MYPSLSSRVAPWVVVSIALSCGGPEPPSRHVPLEASEFSLELTPSPSDGHAYAAVKIGVVPSRRSDTIAADELLLIRGEVSDASLRTLARGELTQTVKSRLVPARFHLGESPWIEPLVLLEPSEIYSVARVGTSVVHTFAVDPLEVPIARRKWPVSSDVPAHLAVVCADDAIAQASSLAANDGTWKVELGVLDAPEPRCATLTKSCATTALSLPVALLDSSGAISALVDPAMPTVEGGAGSCAAPRAQVGPLCFEVQDDRAIVSRGAVDSVVSARLGEQLVGGVLQDGAIVLKGLLPEHPFGVTLEVIDASGAHQSIDVQGVTMAPRPHVVIDEVLADPDGPEPQSEWIEIVNDSARDQELVGWSLEDGGGLTPLPDTSLSAGQVGVIVGADAPAEVFAQIAPSAVLVVVPRVGKSGLSNSGEALALHDGTGWVSSRFPAKPHPKNGKSVSRNRVGSADDDANGFSLTDPTPGFLLPEQTSR
ncbi:MAG: lamin tail domain-containing protein [Polyangiaceae bacterium]